eukprot:730831-Prymnesium_polylepis.1
MAETSAHVPHASAAPRPPGLGLGLSGSRGSASASHVPHNPHTAWVGHRGLNPQILFCASLDCTGGTRTATSLGYKPRAHAKLNGPQLTWSPLDPPPLELCLLLVRELRCVPLCRTSLRVEEVAAILSLTPLHDPPTSFLRGKCQTGLSVRHLACERGSNAQCNARRVRVQFGRLATRRPVQ